MKLQNFHIELYSDLKMFFLKIKVTSKIPALEMTLKKYMPALWIHHHMLAGEYLPWQSPLFSI